MKEETEKRKEIGIIYLQEGNKNDWRERRFHDISEISEEMQRRNIRVGDNVEIGRMVMLGDGCTIENGTKIGNEAVIDKGAYIGQYCNIGEMAIVAEKACLLGNVNMGKDAFIGSDVCQAVVGTLSGATSAFQYPFHHCPWIGREGVSVSYGFR